MVDWRQALEEHLRVYDWREERVQDVRFPVAFVMARDRPIHDVVRELQPLAREENVMLIHRYHGGEDIIEILPRAAPVEDRGAGPTILLSLSAVFTLMAGTFLWAGFQDIETVGWEVLLKPANWFWGFLTFGLPVGTIFAAQEVARRVLAKKHHVRLGRAAFLPIPPFLLPLGTLGAFLRPKDPFPTRKAMFDLAVVGSIATFVVALPILLVGAQLTAAAAIEAPLFGVPDVEVEGLEQVELAAGLLRYEPTDGPTLLSWSINETDWSGTWHVTYQLGNETLEQTQTVEGAVEPQLLALDLPDNATLSEVELRWDDGLGQFGDNLLTKLLGNLFASQDDFLTHPLYAAGWVGMLATGIALIPAGVFNGGYAATALLGDRARLLRLPALVGLAYLGGLFAGWFLVLLFLLFSAVRPHLILDDQEPLGKGRVVVAVLVFVILVITFVWVPFST